MWKTLKAELLEIGSAKITGEPADEFISKSSAGPGLGQKGSVFIEMNGKRVRLNISEDSPVTIFHKGNGSAELFLDNKKIECRLEKQGQHCPKQAFITISPSCIYNCRYCSVPKFSGERKSLERIIELIKNAGDIEAISLTSGVAKSPKEEEENTISIVRELKSFCLPVGVEVYPVKGSAQRLFDAGVSEVKFNLETAAPELFKKFCPGMERNLIETELISAVKLFGRNHVFTNIIVGLGETDEDIKYIVNRLAGFGIIASLRPLTPSKAVSDFSRPTAERLLGLYEVQKEAMLKYSLDTRKALTMCVKCAGCDLVPFVDGD